MKKRLIIPIGGQIERWTGGNDVLNLIAPAPQVQVKYPISAERNIMPHYLSIKPIFPPQSIGLSQKDLVLLSDRSLDTQFRDQILGLAYSEFGRQIQH